MEQKETNVLPKTSAQVEEFRESQRRRQLKILDCTWASPQEIQRMWADVEKREKNFDQGNPPDVPQETIQYCEQCN